MPPPKDHDALIVDLDAAPLRALLEEGKDAVKLAVVLRAGQVLAEGAIEPRLEPPRRLLHGRDARGRDQQVGENGVDLGVIVDRQKELQERRQQRHAGERHVEDCVAVVDHDPFVRRLEARASPRALRHRIGDVAAECAWARARDGEEQRLIAGASGRARIGRVDQMAQLQDEVGIGPAHDRPRQRLTHPRRVLGSALGRGRLGNASEGGHQLPALSRL